MNTIGECRLCLKVRPLCESHLIPAGAFRLLRDPAAKNPNPVYVGDDEAFTSSKQAKDYLLCEPCEQLFTKRGEDWVLANCYRAKDDFKIREALYRHKPAVSDSGGTALYQANLIPEIDVDRLIYFGVSIFWRAGAHTWKHGKDEVHIQLGSYLEPLRLFLLDQGPFPEQMALSLRAFAMDTIGLSAYDPGSVPRAGCHLHAFSIPGLVFSLLVGRRVSAETLHYSLAPSQERCIGISPEIEREDLRLAVGRVKKADDRGFEV
jgi:hypothetical protein